MALCKNPAQIEQDFYEIIFLLGRCEMVCIDTSKLKNAVFHNSGKYEETTTFVHIIENYASLDLDLYMYSGYMLDEPPHRTLAYLSATLYEESVEIVDIISTVENMGNGKLLFFNLLQCIDIINKEQKIIKIKGVLSYVDFDHLDKLIYFYTNMNNYIQRFGENLSYSLEFNFDNEFLIDRFIENVDLAGITYIGFHYNIIPNSQ